ncbi:MAG: Hsp20/alpha crystallin family protein [Candidatus Thermoplasmatota archaeon]|nr:Hsp20/alpha crystallin family protein [Candidatus Thermoplasmatota archaeon]
MFKIFPFILVFIAFSSTTGISATTTILFFSSKTSTKGSLISTSGVEEKAIKTRMKGNILMISAESKDRKYTKEVKLPSVTTGKIESTYKNGVLELKLKKKIKKKK